MTVDPYSPCPGGTGKKIKFCCSDLVTELDRVQRMLDAEQRVAGLEQVEGLLAKHPGRACLLSIKSLLEASVGKREAAEATVKEFCAKFPDNPLAMAEAALLQAERGDWASAIITLQQSIFKSDQELHGRVFEAIGVMARLLLLQGQFLPAQGHVLLQVALTGGRDRRTLEQWMQLVSAPNVPARFKDQPIWQEAPQGVKWSEEFEAARRLAVRGAWSAAVEKFAALSDRAGDSTALWNNLAICYRFLGNYAAASAALRKLASLQTNEDDAVETEALAQLLDQIGGSDLVDRVALTFGVSDGDEIERRLASDSRFERAPFSAQQWNAMHPDQPPPRAVYWLLDRAAVKSHATIARPDVPQVLGEVFTFGKQTDREAALRLAAYRTQLDHAQEILKSVAGDALGEKKEEQIVGHVPSVELALSWQWRLPDDTPPEHRRALVREQRREMLLDTWPNTPLPALGGKTPAAVAADPELRRALMAAVLLMELSENEEEADAEIVALRKKLGLKQPELVNASAVDFSHLPPARCVRLDVASLSDEQLISAFQQVSLLRLSQAMRRVAEELVRRPQIADRDTRATAYLTLVQLESDPAKALAWIDAGRKYAEELKLSTAQWDLEELALRLEQRQSQEAGKLIEHIRDQHIREPGIAQALLETLYEAGVVGPDGRPLAPMPGEESPSLIVPGSASEPGKLWTPEGEASRGGKSSLWVPGME